MMGLKTYEQEIAAAAAHPDTEHAVTVLESLARSLRRREWTPERRAAAYDLAERSKAEARRLIADRTRATADLAAEQLFEAARREQPDASAASWGDLAATQKSYWKQLADQNREAAQEIADRQGYPVHVFCRGEVVRSTTHWEGIPGVAVAVDDLHCHRCDLAVPASEVVEPGDGAESEQAARCDEDGCEWSGTIEAARDAASPEHQEHGITACPACGSLAIIEGKRVRRGKVGTR